MELCTKCSKQPEEEKRKVSEKISINYRYEVYSDNTIKILDLFYGGLQDKADGIKISSGYIEASIPDSFDGIKVTTIGEMAFSYFDNLSIVIIPNGITTICDRAFLGCSQLIDVTIPDSVIYIGNEAFAGCDLRTVVIPKSVTYIGDKAFIGCNNVVYKQ